MGESAFRSLYIFDCIHPTVSKIARVMGTLCKSTALRDMNSGCYLVSHISEERTPELIVPKLYQFPTRSEYMHDPCQQLKRAIPPQMADVKLVCRPEFGHLPPPFIILNISLPHACLKEARQLLYKSTVWYILCP